MTQFTITSVAKRERTPVLIALWGPSGCGKTMTALKLARGLVGPQGKIVLGDTENKRAKIHAAVSSPWTHIDFQPPFSPNAHLDLIKVATEHGADVLIIDSASHVWEGEGGVMDLADAQKTQAGRPRQGLDKWRKPKTQYKKFMNAVMRLPISVIFCVRTKPGFKQHEKPDGRTEIVEIGHVPVCERNFMYEMTVAAELDAETHAPTKRVKAPDDLAGLLRSGPLTEGTGKRIADWLAQDVEAPQPSPAPRELQAKAAAIAEQGVQSFRGWWATQTREVRDQLRPHLDDLHLLSLRPKKPVSDQSGSGDTTTPEAAPALTDGPGSETTEGSGEDLDPRRDLLGAG